jgi:hypothetical protein
MNDDAEIHAVDGYTSLVERTPAVGRLPRERSGASRVPVSRRGHPLETARSLVRVVAVIVSHQLNLAAKNPAVVVNPMEVGGRPQYGLATPKTRRTIECRARSNENTAGGYARRLRPGRGNHNSKDDNE